MTEGEKESLEASADNLGYRDTDTENEVQDGRQEKKFPNNLQLLIGVYELLPILAWSFLMTIVETEA